MKEWFREFQVACERSEQVMQKTSKPVRQLQHHSGTRSAGYSGGIEQEEGIDSIRFCDVTGLPTSVTTTAVGSGNSGIPSGAMSSAGTAKDTTRADGKEYSAAIQAMPVLPASMLEDVPLSVLLAQSVRFVSYIILFLLLIVCGLCDNIQCEFSRDSLIIMYVLNINPSFSTLFPFHRTSLVCKAW